MPDAFFATQKPRKRKRADGASGRPSKQPRTGGRQQQQQQQQPRSSGASKAGPSTAKSGKSRKQRALDEELQSDASGAEGDDAGIGAVDEMDLRASDVDTGASGEEDEDETPAEKRLRLARLYLDSVKEDLGTKCLA
jgi:ribosomal RNA-processing protein 9